MERALLRRVAEQGMINLLGKGLPRKLRRLCGRAYGNAAYRIGHGLPTLPKQGYVKFTVNPMLAKQISVETAKLIEQAQTFVPDPTSMETPDGQV